MVQSGQTVENLVAINPQLSWWQRQQLKREASRFYKAVGSEVAKTLQKQKAAEQGSLVNPTMEAYGSFENAQGIREPVAVSFQLLRALYHNCEPLSAIIDTRVRQAQKFARRAVTVRGYTKQPGFVIRMTDPKEKATAEDRKRIEEITQFMLRGGVCLPPIDERPVGYQRGFTAFTQQVIRDTLTLDAVAVLRWKSDKTGSDGKPAVPLVCFAAEDAAMIRKLQRPYVKMQNGVAVTKDWQGSRTNTRYPITHVMESDNSQVLREYNAFDLAYGVRNPRTERRANGYGYSEAERCINAISFWIAAREGNKCRFDRDSLPRGILSIMGNMSQQQFESFKLQWQQLLMGIENRWTNPIFKASPSAGSNPGTGVSWIPIDMSPRDMENHQTMFTVALWMHSIYGIHPDETGYQALSPFRPPLSEASPETKLEYSQDSGLDPLMTWYEDFLNQEIVWVLEPTERYSIKFMGLGQGDEQADANLWTTLLANGAATPEIMWNEMDQPIPDLLKNDPAMKLPGTWMQNRTILMQMQQAQFSMDQATKQQDMAEQAQTMQQAQGAMMGPDGKPMQPGQQPPGQPQLGQAPPGGQQDRMQNSEGAADEIISKAIDECWI
jgi:hypothetical protein